MSESPIIRPRALICALVLVGCALGIACERPAESPVPAAPAEPTAGGTAVLGSITDIDSWNEYVSRQSFTNNILRRIHLRLAQERGDGLGRPDSFEPLLAESWQASEDGLELTFRLREARWSDGKPITAHDVRFTWTAQTSEDVPWISAGSKSRITDVVVIDERTVAFRFDARYPYQLSDAVEGGILPEHVYGQVPFSEWATHDWSTTVVGSGPFVLERHTPGHEIVLTRNRAYYGDGPLLDGVVVRVVPDLTNLLAQLRTGEIDYLEGITPRDAEQLAGDDRLTLLPFDYPNYDFIGWNGSRPPFDRPDVRRALTMAIDRDALVEDLLYGYGEVSRGPLLSYWWGADPALEPWPYDPDGAREVLAAAGYRTVGADGAERTPGETLTLELLTNNGNRLREEMLVKIQAQLARVGVEAEIRLLEMRSLRQRAAAGDYDGYLGGWTYSLQDLPSVFDSEATFPHGANVVYYKSLEVDRLFDELERAEEWAEMKPELTELQRQIHADQPYTFLYERKRVAVAGPRLGGVEIDIPTDPLAGLEHFWIK